MGNEVGDGLVHLRSAHSVLETIVRLKAIVKRRGLAVLAHVDHSGDAERAGLAMLPMQLLLFGNAAAGTPLMIASPAAGIDLPLKALAWQAAEGDVWLTYNSVDYFKARHDLPDSLVTKIVGIAAICQEAAGS